MSVRDEIRAALSKEGASTCTELVDHCPSANGNRQMVLTSLQALRTEGKVKPCGLEAGEPLYDIADWPGEGEPLLRVPGSALEKTPAPEPEPRTLIASRAIASNPAAERAQDRAPSPATTPAPVSAAATQENSMATIREKIEKHLREHGPADSRTMRKQGLKQDDLAVYLAGMLKREQLVRLGGGPASTVYGLPGQKLPKADMLEAGGELGRRTPPQQPKPAKKPKAPKAKAVAQKPRQARAAPPAPPAPSQNGAAHFAINHRGELGIEKADTRVTLSGAEFGELREFISRTQNVWNASA